MFGNASGLRVNVAKSIAISLRPETSAFPTKLGALKVLRDGEHCQYYGVLVGAGAIGIANWSRCIRAITTRLALARLKTNPPRLRVVIEPAVVMPKILCVARHSGPFQAVVATLQTLVKKFVWGC